MEEERKETRQVTDFWDLGLYRWKVEADGLKLLVDGLKDKKILGRKCGACGMVYVPGVTYCRKCFVDIEEVVEVQNTGRIMTYTVNLADVRGNLLDDPVALCCIRMDGSDSWLMGTLESDDWKRVHVGMPVKIRFREESKGELADIECFEPLES